MSSDDKNETTRFLGDGVSFKAKLIGILEVSEARGDRMCQEALSDLKMAIRAAGEHKQRITINIAIDGLRLRDEKTGDSLYHHPVHKISFIAQDMTDSRAFGYIFGSPDTGHRFFGIKTDKAASQVVIAMRDLFQVVFALKKKEIELAKQHLEKTCYPPSPLFSDSSSSSSKLQSVPHVSIKSVTESKAAGNTGVNDTKNASGTAVADLVDLELELNSLQQGLNQMERITPSDPFGTKDDPFGDSFISYPAKPILPPPPSSNRERSSRTSESSSSIFSPKTPRTGGTIDTASSCSTKKGFSFSHEFDSLQDEPNSGDWFAASSSIFEESSPPTSAPSMEKDSRDAKHEQTKQEILSQFDVFTELDPLGTGRSKPYIDRKHFFQELKNPPKKALNELVTTNSTTQEPSLFATNFQLNLKSGTVAGTASTQGVFTVDPFGEDPFVKEDPFSDSDFSKQDPFEMEFANFSSNQNGLEKCKVKDTPQPVLSKSPTEKQAPFISSSPNVATTAFAKHTFNDNPSLDVSSEGECAPEPPPRPLTHIRPPPLPPKKQGEIGVGRPPPRPPQHTALDHYDYMDRYETEANISEGAMGIDDSPPLPVPARKSRIDGDLPFGSAPDRPKKQFNVSSSEEDYLTPITFPEKNMILPPPPKKNVKKQTVETRSCESFEGLDISLSQLTLTGLNELAHQLNIPAGQLNNMTLVQLTNFISNFIKSSSSVSVNSKIDAGATNSNEFPAFQADFATNFSNSDNSTTDTTYDRYAVFRELIQEEIKQTKIDSEPEEISEEKEKLENSVNSNIQLELKPLNEESTTDRYAALREIAEIELKQFEISKDEVNQNQVQNEIQDILEEEEEGEGGLENEEIITADKTKETENNIINRENKFMEDNIKEIVSPIKRNIIEYSTPLDNKENRVPVKSPVKSTIVKSPIPSAITEIVQGNTRLTSGSLSDVISGSSPEVDNTASNSDVCRKINDDVTGESWAIFDRATAPTETINNKEAAPPQSEEGASPWSSDSKEEYGDASPLEWTAKDCGTEQKWSKRKDQDGWWDTSAEPEVHYCQSNRRSTDSYDDEDLYLRERERYEEKPSHTRRKRHPSNWKTGVSSGQASGTGGGHSSSSRDVSPWEEEPRRPRGGGTGRHMTRGSHSCDKRQHPTDSWDEEDDDYEYDDEEHTSRFHWSDRHGSRDTDKEIRHSTSSREYDSDRWCDDRHTRRRRDLRDRWCCPDWEQGDYDKVKYSSGPRRPNVDGAPFPAINKRRSDSYYTPGSGSHESQESPWEDEYQDDAEEPPAQYTKRGWKQRPSSAADAERKVAAESKSRYYIGAGGSDGERDRRYKPTKRSRSRDSQYGESIRWYKPEVGMPARNVFRAKPHSKPVIDTFPEILCKKSEFKENNKKSSTLSRKKSKDGLKREETVSGTFPRKSSSRSKSLFENDFIIPSEVRSGGTKFDFEDLEISEPETPVVIRPTKAIRQQTMFEKGSSIGGREVREQRVGSLRESKLSPRYHTKSKSLFEDDFLPSEKSETVPDDSISSIKEETDREEEDQFGASNLENAKNGRRRILQKNRLSVGGARSTDAAHLKKSGSVNIFAREDDPFDDDFFCGENMDDEERPPKITNMELRWTEDFDN